MAQWEARWAGGQEGMSSVQRLLCAQLRTGPSVSPWPHKNALPASGSPGSRPRQSGWWQGGLASSGPCSVPLLHHSCVLRQSRGLVKLQQEKGKGRERERQTEGSS